MLTGWTNSNAKKFKQIYHQVIGNLPDTEPLDLELFHEFEKQEEAMEASAAHTRYENRTKEDLYHLAQERDIDGRSTMNKSELIDALRAHH